MACLRIRLLVCLKLARGETSETAKVRESILAVETLVYSIRRYLELKWPKDRYCAAHVTLWKDLEPKHCFHLRHYHLIRSTSGAILMIALLILGSPFFLSFSKFS